MSLFFGGGIEYAMVIEVECLCLHVCIAGDLPIQKGSCVILKKDMNRILVEGTIRRTLKSMKESPERTIRNLVDLGLNFSNGRFQTRFLKAAQEMLHNQKSAYYSLVKHVAASVDHDLLTTFGVNLGYNSCTLGAKRIREIEAERGYNIPWSLTLAINEEKLDAEPDFYPTVVRQGIPMGIYTYLLFSIGDPEKLLPLMKAQPDCAFIVFLRGHQISDAFIRKMKAVKNVMISIYVNEDMPGACQKLRDARLLYAVYQRYTEQDREHILSGQWLSTVLPVHPAFAFLRTEPGCDPETQEGIYSYVTSVRDGQQYPVVLMDIKQDTLQIDRVISDGECLVGFDFDGSLKTHEGIMRGEEYNIFHHRLEDVLQAAAI